MQNDWTFEQLLGLSPDHFTIRSGQGNAKQNKWKSIGQKGDLVWGEFDNNTRPPFQTCLLLKHMYFSCNCTSRKFPCQHIVGLHLLWHSAPHLFEEQAVPKWVRLSQTRFLQQWHQQSKPNKRLISKPALQELQKGLSELERWLHDLIQNGLATLPEKKKGYWETIANRMADAQALNLTHQLHELMTFGQAQPDWPEHYLRQLGSMALLITSFKRFDQQPLNVQADLVGATGRPLPHLYNGRPALHDRWLVLGHASETIGSHQKQHTWVWGLKHNQPAQLSQTIRGKHPIGIRYMTGSILTAELKYAAGTWPLNAKLITKPTISQAASTDIGEPSILTAVQTYTSAKTKNPWLQRLPLLLKKAAPVHENGRWSLVDEQQYALPLPQKFNYSWHLKALYSGQPLTLFGLWDGTLFAPLSAKVAENWVDLHTFRGIK